MQNFQFEKKIIVHHSHPP